MSADCTAAKHRPTQHCASRGRLRRLCCACCLCAAASGQRALCGTFGPTAILKTCRKVRYYSAAANSAQLRLDQNLPIGYDAAQAVCISLGQPISSSAIPAKADDKDTLIFPADLTGSMETALGSQKLRLETGLTNTDLFKEIYKSLKKKKPVIALMLVADAESAKLQYGVVSRP